MGDLANNTLINDIKTILHNAKNRIYQTINSTMTATYWEIGRRIVEEEQQGKRNFYEIESIQNSWSLR